MSAFRAVLLASACGALLACGTNKQERDTSGLFTSADGLSAPPAGGTTTAGAGAPTAGAPMAGTPTGTAGDMMLPPPTTSAGTGGELPPPDRTSPTTPTAITHPAGDTVRFIAVGDTGTGEADQLAVAAVMVDVCERDGCDFVIMLGDNIYDQGAISVDDPQWQTKFEQPYAALDVPFYVTLGNHDVADNGLFGTGYSPAKIAVEVQYAQKSSKWMMPAAHYSLSAGPVGFLMLDTTSLYTHMVTTFGDQHKWVGPARDTLRDAHAWVLSAGHHPYVSNGDHGNAGTYAYFDFDTGVEIRDFFKTNLCGQIDITLSGHDHNRQWLDPNLCAGTDSIVSGAGAKVRGLSGGNPALWQSEELGFLYVVADAKTLTGKFIGIDGTVEYERTLTK